MRLVDMFLDGHENSDLVFCLLWQRSSSMLLESFLDRYRRDPLSVSQILDLIQESKVRPTTTICYSFLGHSLTWP